MINAYILLYGDQVAREVVRAWADSCDLVYTWRYDLVGSIYLISAYSAKELAEQFREFCAPAKVRFLVTEVTENRWGWMPPETWYLFRHKRQQPKTK